MGGFASFHEILKVLSRAPSNILSDEHILRTSCILLFSSRVALSYNRTEIHTLRKLFVDHRIFPRFEVDLVSCLRNERSKEIMKGARLGIAELKDRNLSI